MKKKFTTELSREFKRLTPVTEIHIFFKLAGNFDLCTCKRRSATKPVDGFLIKFQRKDLHSERIAKMCVLEAHTKHVIYKTEQTSCASRKKPI